MIELLFAIWFLYYVVMIFFMGFMYGIEAQKGEDSEWYVIPMAAAIWPLICYHSIKRNWGKSK